MAITVSKTKRWASSEIYQEADKTAALTTKAKKISPGKSIEVLLKAKSPGNEHSKQRTPQQICRKGSCSEPESEQLAARRGFSYQATKELLRGSFPFRQLPAAPERKQNQLSCTH